MKIFTLFRFLHVVLILIICNSAFSQAPDFKVQHLEVDVPGGGLTLTAPSNFTAISDINKAFILINNNRRNGAGPDYFSGNVEARALSCTVSFSNTGTIVFSRGAGAIISTRVNITIVEYIGPVGGANEFIVRHRGVLTPSNAFAPQTIPMTSIPTDINKCIPFYSVLTADILNGGAADTFMAFCSGVNTLNYHRGGFLNWVTASVEVVEFTGSNWSVGHGDSGSVGNDTGTITLNTSSTGSGGSVFNVGSFNNALIWHTYKGDSNSGINESMSDNYPIYRPNGTTKVDWTFDKDHDGFSERHFVHVLSNPYMKVTRFSDDSNKADENTINITSAGLTDVNQALIMGTSISDGKGTAYGRGWRNYYLKSSTVAAHWSHRNKNKMDHEIQIIDLKGLTTAISGPEINLVGNGNSIINGDTTPSTTDNTDFGFAIIGTPVSKTFTIQNNGMLPLQITGTPKVRIIGANAIDFTVITQPTLSIAASGSSNFVISYNPTAIGNSFATVIIENNDSDENPYNFDIIGKVDINKGPGGVINDLGLWLKADDGLPYTNGQRVSTWFDKGRGSNATVPTNVDKPTYRDDANYNVNFNPVLDFDNSYNSVPLDGDFSYDNPSTQFLQGPNGFYSQEIFVVLIPDVTVNSSFGSMDVFCGDKRPAINETDATGLGLGNYSTRFSGEVLSYTLGTTNGLNGYGVAETGSGITYNNAGIINTRNNATSTRQELFYNAINKETTQNDIADFSNVNNSKFWIGRSEGLEASTEARIAEIITYSVRKSDTDLTMERNRIQSYLAIKYGITLGDNGTSQSYVDSQGNIIWNQAANAGYNYNIAGIGRDDISQLIQKQSKSINNAIDAIGPTQGILTIGLKDIYDTNNQNKSNNATNFGIDRQYLVWGDNGASLNLAASTITVNISAGVTPALSTNVTFTAMQRIWKVVENRNGGDIPKVKISIPQNALRNISPPGDYYMFISSSSVFGTTSDYRLMTPDGNGNLVTEYDFDNTKYITFGYAPQVIIEGSVYFDGAKDYIDMENKLNLNPLGFTISAWIKRDMGALNASIVSKRDAAFTQGYDFKINATGRLEMTWKTPSIQSVVSTVVIPENEWHYVAVTYKAGVATIYIDGVANTSAAKTAPVTTTESFYIAAAGKNSPTAYFKGNIDEVRIWNTDLSQDQLRFVMNQEIVNNGSFVNGKIIPLTISKNEVAGIPWAKLAGYYPMSVYTYTNINDASGNGNQGALRNLNTVDRQTAPLPYESSQKGTWDSKTTWKNGNLQYLPGSTSIADPLQTVNWNIIKTTHDIEMDNLSLPVSNNLNRTVLALWVNNEKLYISGNTNSNTGYGLTVTHYLKLDGTIVLKGESQLIQTTDSDFATTSSGQLERDQQGTADKFTYNYWSSPVGVKNVTTNNNSYKITDVMKDGNKNINWLTSGYNGSPGNPIEIADYWIWKYANLPNNSYASWQHVRSTGTINAGEGFTMKGPGTGSISSQQNYVFKGKPNNGDITLTMSGNNDYLIGNPYPSALNAEQFILDNGSVITGTGATNGSLYFWEHWGGGSHVLSEYQGGYAIYNLSGGTAAASKGTNDPKVATGGVSTKIPGKYIPIGQSFFVVAENSGGTIKFNNGQRVFKKEGSSESVFIRESQGKASTDYNPDGQDVRMKFRIGFNSTNSIYRQLLLTIDQNTSKGIDWGYDAPSIDNQIDDMYWMINDEKYNIQAIDNIDDSSSFPLGLHLKTTGQNIISIDHLENVPETIEIYLHDKLLDIYHNLRNSDYSFTLSAGEYLDRFELKFDNNNVLSFEENELSNIDVYYANNSESIVLLNPTLQKIKKIELFNLLGQSVHVLSKIQESEYSEYKVKNLSTGTYIVKMHTENGTASKKVLIK